MSNFKNSNLWQQQLTPVQKTTSTKSKSTSSTKDFALPHHLTMGFTPLSSSISTR
jgi:hypothetical protein